VRGMLTSSSCYSTLISGVLRHGPYSHAFFQVNSKRFAEVTSKFAMTAAQKQKVVISESAARQWLAPHDSPGSSGCPMFRFLKRGGFPVFRWKLLRQLMNSMSRSGVPRPG
jgi:hypothetical protein